MKIVHNYTDKINDIILSEENYTLPYGLTLSDDEYILTNVEKPEIALNVFSTANIFQSRFKLILNTDFYVKNDQIFLKPNELLDREGFFANDYNLRFDFISPIRNDVSDTLYISEISPSRREVRLGTPATTIEGTVYKSNVNKSGLKNVTSATKYMHQASAWRDISMLFNDLEILNTDDSLCSKSNVRSRDKLSINATNQTCILKQ